MSYTSFNSVLIRKACIDDFDSFYKIKSEDNDMAWSGHAGRPDYDHLFNFYAKILNGEHCREERTIYVIEVDGEFAGYMYMDKIDKNNFQLSIGVSESFSGKHVARTSLSKLMNELRELNQQTNFTAWIRIDNLASLKAFQAAGFVKTNTYQMAWIPSINKEIAMFQFVNMS